MKIPKQYLPVMPYLIVNNAKAFLEFTKSVFGATEQMIVPSEDDKIRHGELKIYDAVIMFAGAVNDWKEKSSAMYIYVEDVNAVYNNAIKQGAKSLGQPELKEYGYTAGFEDQFGNHWFIAEPEFKDS